MDRRRRWWIWFRASRRIGASILLWTATLGYDQNALERSIEVIGKSEELAAEDLRSAAYALGRLLGQVDVEDILDVIFREFCIGK